MATLDRDGMAIHYETTGQGTPVLLTHGFAATHRMWQPQVAAFASRCRFITWDLRGHGASGCLDDASRYTHELTVDDMCALLDAHGVERAIIGGHSLGGFLSLRFHLAHPDRVAALYLQGCGPGYRSDKGRAEWNERSARRAAAFEARGLDALGGAGEVRREEHHSAIGLAHAARGILSQQDGRVIESLPSIAVPTLITIGERDATFLAGTAYMEEKIPGAVRVVVADAGHPCNLEQPQVVNAAFASLLDRLG